MKIKLFIAILILTLFSIFIGCKKNDAAITITNKKEQVYLRLGTINQSGDTILYNIQIVK